MARIKVNPEQVNNLARWFTQAGLESQQLIDTLNKSVNILQPDWEGMSSQEFYKDFQQWNSDMKKYAEFLSVVGKQLNTIAARFANADGQNVSIGEGNINTISAGNQSSGNGSGGGGGNTW